MSRSVQIKALRHHRLTASVLAALWPMAVAAAPAPALEFNAEFLQGGGANLDISRYLQAGPAPGIYSADVTVNGAIVGRQDVEVRLIDGESRICLGPELFELIGLDAGKVETQRGKREAGEMLPLPDALSCESIERFLPGASAELDAAEQVLSISVPQIYLSANRTGWVASDRWDHGINAMLLNYSINHARSVYAGRHSNRTSATLDAGLNLGAWRIRHNGYLSQDGNGDYAYNAGRTYAQREVRAWNAQLTVGESSTRGDLFDSVNYLGANLSTDPRMLPDALNSYAPVVRGVAQTNARVTIRQRGVVIYETTVAPGPFEIDDLTQRSGSGDFEVEVSEADGRVESFVVPFAAVPQLLRQGQQRASLTVGELRHAELASAPTFVEATLRRGVGSAFTAFGGATASEGYNAIILGGALNTRIGAFSGDVTFSDTRLPVAVEGFGGRMQGQSYRLAYSRSFNTATSFTLAAYRYSTEGYLNLSDAARLRSDLETGRAGAGPSRQRSRLDLTLNQQLPKGSLFLNGSTADYWSENRRTTNFSLGYNGRLGRASYSVSARRTLESSLLGGAQKQTTGAYLSVSMPLGRAPAAPRLSASANSGQNGGNYRAGLSGNFGESRQGNYNVSMSQSSGGRDVGMNVGYVAPMASLSASWNRSENSQQLGLSASGGVLLHAGGLTLSQRMGDTVGLVHVPDAVGAGVGNQRGVKTDRRGYAVVPFLSAYRMNDIPVDPTGLSLDVELKAGSASAVPTAGAVIKAVIPTSSGRSALIEALDHDGQPLAFGLDVYDEADRVVGVVGQGSRLWVRGINEKGTLRVQRGDDVMSHCAIDYDLSMATEGALYISQCLRSTRAMTSTADGAAH
ncbi:fimbria/pilus outer membrane usher protein [Stenotrophomonas sp. RAC2]|uniref:fimbria/pilus outer membrane usher protein n=1 Tax=Stenotrophomonas sp. RAC2 TaxID=3064902 RepID=UPI00271B4E57|nr:fimbria/pilus outer membrane usher protein [Stenotrophomonas sp. RAC2]MDV9043865.1 fimbria/pilus outer membrane usher protein [Stenotrophomonas sp. RAC2]